jgi:uncharacterized protein
MPFEVARATIDYLLARPDLFPERNVVWEFIGGEPLLELDLMDQIINYALKRTWELRHPWFEAGHFSITTNGLLYGTDSVQRFISAHRSRLGVAISVDGPEYVHDLARVACDGSGSYRKVVANVPLWLKQYPNANTKVTISHENLPYVAESILHLFDLGIREVHSNVVFEDVWKPGDDDLLERQLDDLADAMIERNLWRTHTCTFFQRQIGQPMRVAGFRGNWCGSGKMLAVDSSGRFYPCNRFLPFSLRKREARTLGNVHDGLDVNRLRPFLALTAAAQSPRECMECEVATGCAWCQGLNYDDAATPTIYQRATYLCKMHKARVRANRRYWDRVDELAATMPAGNRTE